MASSRSMLSVIRNTFVASHLTSHCVAVNARRHASAAAAAERHQLVTVELISDTM